MTLFEPIAHRLRARSARLLATAIAFEIAGSASILFFWPAGWALGLVLVTTAALRVYSLADRARDTVSGPGAAVYLTVRRLAALTALAAVALLVLGTLRIVLVGGWV